MQYIDTIPVFGTHEANTLEQAAQCARTADRFALMADGHLGYGVPIGGVIASESRISPTAAASTSPAATRPCASTCRAQNSAPTSTA